MDMLLVPSLLCVTGIVSVSINTQSAPMLADTDWLTLEPPTVKEQAQWPLVGMVIVPLVAAFLTYNFAVVIDWLDAIFPVLLHSTLPIR